jgi:hypothetical protein
MSQRVKVKVQPGQTVCFPGLCVYNLQPAVATMRIRKRSGRITREIDVPLSAAAAALLQSRAPAEERWLWGGRAAALLLALLVLLLTTSYGPLPLPTAARLFLGLVFAGLLAYTGWRWAARWSFRRAAAEKQAVVDAVAIDAFSWRATTFRFARDAYAEQFAALNEPHLMDVTPLP